MKEEKGKWLNQTEATMYCGISQASFLNRIKPKLMHKMLRQKTSLFSSI